jgi:LysM repeat protein
VVVLFLLGLMVGVAVLLSSTSQASAPAGPARTIVVHPGDTLWSISVAALPEVNPDAAVERVRQLNHKNDNTIYVGEELTLPPTR